MVNLSTIVLRPLRRLKQMSQENREMLERLAALERSIEITGQQYMERLTALEHSLAEKQQTSTAPQDLLEQKVRFLLAENIRLNQVLRELIYFNHLKRSETGSQTKESFDYQWREVGEGK